MIKIVPPSSSTGEIALINVLGTILVNKISRAEKFRIQRDANMEKLSVRLARKKNPLYAQAKALAKSMHAASLVEEEGDSMDEEVFASIGEIFERPTDAEFTDFSIMVADNLSLYSNGANLKDDFLNCLEYIATSELPSTEEAVTLMLLPISVLGDPSLFESIIGKRQKEKIIKILKNSDYVNEDAQVMLAPKLLKVSDIAQMNHRRIRLLADTVLTEDQEGFNEVLAEFQDEQGDEEMLVLGEGWMLGAIFAVVAGTGLVHLPVLSAFESEELAEEISFEDIDRINALVGKEAAKVKAVKEMKVIGLPMPWFEAEFVLRKIQRQIALSLDITEVLEEAGIGAFAGVFAAQIGVGNSELGRIVRIGIFSKADGEKAGEVEWLVMDEEVGDEQQTAIAMECSEFGVEYQGELDDESTIGEMIERAIDGEPETVAQKTLH